MIRHLVWGAALIAAPLSATTLREALASAYRTSPVLTGARAGQRATDEAVPIALARGVPSVNATAAYQEFAVRSANSFSAPLRAVTAGAQLSVPVYQGGGVRSAVRAADARVDAGQATLRDTEAMLFSQVVAAYMDVIRDEAIVGLNRANVNVLKVNLDATRDRFQVGDLTRTDVAQSQARLALAQGQLESAESQLITSREGYVRLVGAPPVDLQPPPPLPGLPADPQGAVTVALDHNPALLAAMREREASRFDVGVARATRLPRVAIVAGPQYTNYLNSLGTGITGSSFAQTDTTFTGGVNLTLPLFQGGGPAAQVRQAQAREGQAIERVTETERGIVAQTRSAYASWQASNALIASSQTAVDASRLSLEGVRAENSVGNRTILDILNAEQELLNSQVNLVTARRNSYVAGFTLIAAMGQAEARDLGLDAGPLYDPETNYKRVKGRQFFDWDSDPKPTPQATRTIDTPPQTATVQGPPAQ